MTRVVIVGGGPGGYEAALVGSQLGGEVTLVDTDGLGGSAVLTDCVPVQDLIATAEVMTEVRSRPSSACGSATGSDDLRAACASTWRRSTAECWTWPESSPATSWNGSAGRTSDIVIGKGRLDGPDRVIARPPTGEESFDADMILVATGATPRELPDAGPTASGSSPGPRSTA